MTCSWPNRHRKVEKGLSLCLGPRDEPEKGSHSQTSRPDVEVDDGVDAPLTLADIDVRGRGPRITVSRRHSSHAFRSRSEHSSAFQRTASARGRPPSTPLRPHPHTRQETHPMDIKGFLNASETTKDPGLDSPFQLELSRLRYAEARLSELRQEIALVDTLRPQQEWYAVRGPAFHQLWQQNSQFLEAMDEIRTKYIELKDQLLASSAGLSSRIEADVPKTDLPQLNRCT